MIEVRASLLIVADDDTKADEVLAELLRPRPGGTRVKVVESSREEFDGRAHVGGAK